MTAMVCCLWIFSLGAASTLHAETDSVKAKRLTQKLKVNLDADAKAQDSQTIDLEELLSKGYQIEVEYRDKDTLTEEEEEALLKKEAEEERKLALAKEEALKKQIQEDLERAKELNATFQKELAKEKNATAEALKELENKERKTTAASKYFLNAQDKFYSSEYELALLEVNRAILLAPKISPYHALQGSIYYKLKEVDNAKSSWETALALDPSDSKVEIALNKLNRLF